MMKASVAKVDITPSRAANPYLAGYGVDTPREATNDTPHSPLHARCLVLWDNGNPNALVAVDILGLPRSMHHAIRQRILALHGSWASSDIVILTSHTHNGPVLCDRPDPFTLYNLADTTLVGSYSDWLADRIVDVASAALAAPQVACTLDYTVASESFSFNRVGLPYTETAVPVLTARGNDGKPVAVLFSYGCHPVSAGCQTLYDGDYPARACEVIETDSGAMALFALGPAGDQNPSGLAGFDGFDLSDELGRRLGKTVLDAIATPGRSLGSPILTNYAEFNLPLDITNTPDNLALAKTFYQTRQADAGTPGYKRRHAGLMAQQIETGTFDTIVPLPVQVWKFQGDPVLRFVFTGGELVSGYGVYFRSHYGGADGLLIGGYANENPCYLSSDELLPPIRTGGSYEGGWDVDYPGLAGGSQAVYGWLGHFLPGAGGVESKLIAAIKSLLD